MRESSVQVSCDGQPIIAWSGDVQQFALNRRFWTNIPADRLFIGTWATTFRISKMELVPLP